MQRTAEQLRNDARHIWQAGVDAVRPERLVPQFVHVDGDRLLLGDEVLSLDAVGRIAVVGAGKAGAAMVTALEGALGEQVLQEKQVTGCVNVPADCLTATAAVSLHAARPPGINEPTAEGVDGTQRILELVGSLGTERLVYRTHLRRRLGPAARADQRHHAQGEGGRRAAPGGGRGDHRAAQRGATRTEPGERAAGWPGLAAPGGSFR